MTRAGILLRRWPWCLALLAWSAAAAPGSLEACLAQFDGIRWKLPYRPFMHVYRCAGPEASFNAAGPIGGDRRRLELIGDTTLEPLRPGGRADVTFAQLQQAVFAHFDALLRGQGFQRVEVEQHDSRGESYPARATYARGGATLTWSGEAANTWVITMQPAGAAR